MGTWNLRDMRTLHLVHTPELYKEFLLSGDSPDALSPLPELPSISSVNMFVGANHSGKSRFLRALAKNQRMRATPARDDPQWKDFQVALQVLRSAEERLNRHLVASVPPSGHAGIEGLRARVQNIPSSILVTDDGLLDISNIENGLRSPEGISVVDIPSARKQVDYFLSCLERLLKIVPPKPFGGALGRIYVPVLRGLRILDSNATPAQHTKQSRDPFRERTGKDYSIHSGIEIFTGHSLYYRVRDMLLGKSDQRQRIRDYEAFLSTTFFDDQALTLTPDWESGTLHITLEGEEDRPIHDLGDGLQSAIILTFESFVRTDSPCLFFIEEPEMFLHPGLQRRILDFFLKQEKHVFFLTTHSNHFLDMTLDYGDISIYNFRRHAPDPDSGSPRFSITPVSQGDRSSLELLGVRNSSVFLVNATIWVEGITDRLYLRKYLELYVNAHPELEGKLREDTHYAFVEYGGANLPHWSLASQEGEQERPIEVKTLCGRALLVVDRDSAGWKQERIEKLQRSLGEDHVIPTEGREIENLLPAHILEQVVEAGEGTFRRDEYRDEKIAEYIDRKLGRAKYAGEGGALKNKVSFCRKAIQAMEKTGMTFEDLDTEVQEMVQRIYKFLRKENGTPAQLGHAE